MLSLFLFAFILLSVQAEADPAFCKICKCSQSIDKIYNVTCDTQITLYDEKNWWINKATNSTYQFNKVVIENSPILTLDQEFSESKLKILYLSGNSIVTIKAGVFQNLQNMEELVLSHNNIEIIDPQAFKGKYVEGDLYPLLALEQLYLDHNKIHTLSANVFEHTSRLTELYLNHNPLKVIDQHTAQAITSLPYLKKLDLSYSGLDSLPDYFLHTPKYLEYLDLAGNQFTKIPQTLGDSHALVTLYFNNNPIVNLTSDNGFPQIKTLKELHMRKMELLRNVSDHALAKLEALEELYISDCGSLTHVSGKALSSHVEDSEYETWPSIKKLHLNNNQLASLDFHLLNNWPSLYDLDLTGNPWTCECENQWIIDELMPIYLHINKEQAESIQCAAPSEMVEFTLFNLFVEKEQMRCLDKYGNHPENDGYLLIGILAGVLITIPIILSILYMYKRHWFGIFDNSPAAFSRQFYSRTEAFEDNI